MSKTPFSKKCEILGSLWILYRDDDSRADAWVEFFAWADVALPLSYMAWQNVATPKPEGKAFIEEAWSMYCNILGIDANAKWDNLRHTFDNAASNVA